MVAVARVVIVQTKQVMNITSNVEVPKDNLGIEVASNEVEDLRAIIKAVKVLEKVISLISRKV